jgi:K+-transporting ATPase ATPase C chain
MSSLLIGLRLTIVLTFLLGIVFPMLVTLIAGLLFPHQAHGSLLVDSKGTVFGSELCAQNFSQPKYFHPRPSAAGSGYAGEASSGTNLGPTSAKLIDGVADDPATKADESFSGIKQLAESYKQENQLTAEERVPVDAVTRSGSGLDPDITPANAAFQSRRVAQARNLPLEKVLDIVHANTQQRDVTVFGEPRINVLKLNLALDAMPQDTKR